MKIFEFDNEDLRLNQHGQISQRQIEWLRRFKPRIRSFAWMVAILLLSLFLILALFLMNEGGYAVRYSNLSNRNVLVAIGFGMIGILGMSIFVARRNASELNEPQLLSVEGRIKIHVDDSGYQVSVSIGKTFFNVQEDISRVFLEGERYRVYYCKSGAYRFILSYEKLDN